ncbi:hypothetical protein AJ80_06476 [Polytolypa hystricis UAMH7299]|uniref:Altered inheritance of mitochondria protein 9, mitochondrial n=1 Tax=Polytolypa hystricis (strain UAMH7299) TaxID=1447883 RepID=A0A2B7XMV6_POLH7|nr:hypothetical protein AJ80_06476 [Polytolypa hystricis UAMH7299]
MDQQARILAQLSPPQHIELLNKYLASIPTLLPNKPDLLRPTLWHRDIHDGNLFVHDGKISSVIDWQSVWAGPLILQTRTPQIIDYSGEINLGIPENFKQLDQDEKTRVRDQVLHSMQICIYETNTAKINPLLSKAFRQPFGKHCLSLSTLLETHGTMTFFPSESGFTNLPHAEHLPILILPETGLNLSAPLVRIILRQTKFANTGRMEKGTTNYKTSGIH